MNTLICPHCDGTASERARVCRGCGAEIVRGATRKEQSAGGCITTILGIPIMLAMVSIFQLIPGVRDENALYFFVGIFLFMSATYQIGGLLARRLHRSKLRFFRSYEHS